MRTLLLCLLLFVSLSTFSQISFEKAYFIDNNGLKTDCLIKNLDWVNNPVNFEFKLSADDTPKTMDVSSVKEFGINDFSRYVSADVKIDRSKTKQTELTRIKEPEWSDERLFLKVLIEGKATLYYYVDFYHTRFFYNVNNSTIEQLIFKEYYSANDVALPNNKFRQQLWANIRCESLSQKYVEAMNYRQSEIVNYFKKYYACSGEPYVEYNKIDNTDAFKLRIMAGLTISSLSVNYETYQINPKPKPNFGATFNSDYGKNISFCIGMEAEYLLPARKKKWAIVFEPTFQYFQNSSYPITTYGPMTVKLNYVEMPFGLRRYFLLNQNVKLNLNLLISPLSLDIGSKLGLPNLYDGDYALIKHHPFLAAGIGLSYKKFIAEVRFCTEYTFTIDQHYESDDYKNPYGVSQYWNTDYHKLSFILGYELF